MKNYARVRTLWLDNEAANADIDLGAGERVDRFEFADQGGFYVYIVKEWAK